MTTVGVVTAVVPEGAAADGVDDDEEDEEDDVDGGHLLPVSLQIGQHPGLARLAVVAEHRLVVAPSVAVLVGVGAVIRRLIPHRRAPVGEVAGRWWLAATRLVLRNKQTTRKNLYQMLPIHGF